MIEQRLFLRMGRSGAGSAGYMKSVILVCLAVAVALSTSTASAETYQVDSIHSYILFRVKHLGIGYTYGQFIGVTGSFVFDAPKGAGNEIQMKVVAKNIFTGDTKRDNHLRSPDFFDAEQFPWITFSGKLARKIKDRQYLMTGELTILGVTRPVRAEVTETGHGKDPQGKQRRGFETRFTVKRSEFGMNFMLGSISDTVDLTISVEGTIP